MGKKKGTDEPDNRTDSPSRKTQSGKPDGRSHSPTKVKAEENGVATTFVKVESSLPFCFTHQQKAPCILGEKFPKVKHNRFSGCKPLCNGLAREFFIMTQPCETESTESLSCDYCRKKLQTQQQPLYHIPAKFLSLNGLSEGNGAVTCSRCHMRRIGLLSPERWCETQPQVVRCPACEAQDRKGTHKDSGSITSGTSSSSSSSISDTDDVGFTRIPRQSRPRYSNHRNPRATLPTSIPVTLIHQCDHSPQQTHRQRDSSPRRISPWRFDTHKSEPEIAPQHQHMNLPTHQSGDSWGHEDVKLVYENRRQELTPRSPRPPRRSKSAFQPTRRFDSDLHTARIDGASRIIYASKPDRPGYPNVPIQRMNPSKDSTTGFRREINLSSSSESISTSITSLLPRPVGQQPEIELDVIPTSSERPYDNRRTNGNNVKLEVATPSGIPHFDNGEGTRIGPQARIGYQDDQLVPRRRNAKNPDMNMSFNFQCGENSRFTAFTPDTSFGVFPSTSNMRIQGRSKRSDPPSSSLPTDTPIGANGLDDTLETVEFLRLPPAPQIPKPRTPPPHMRSPSEEESQSAILRNGTTGRQEDDVGESAFSSHAYEVLQNSRSDGPPEHGYGIHAGGPRISNNTKDNFPLPSQQFQKCIDKEPQQPPLTKSQKGVDDFKVDRNGKSPEQTENDEIDSRFDLSSKVSVQIGNLIQKRLKELSKSLGMDSQPLHRKYATSNQDNIQNLAPKLPQTTPMGSEERTPSDPPPQAFTQTSDKPFENMDTFIDRQFSGLTRHQRETSKGVMEPMPHQPSLVGWRDSVDPPYQNLVMAKNPDSFVSRRVREFNGRPESRAMPPADMRIQFRGSAGSSSSTFVQKGQFITQRVKELMAASGETYSVTSNATAEVLAAPKSDQPRLHLDDFRLVAVLGQGNFGKILLAEYKENNTYYALKTLEKAELVRGKNVDCMKIEKCVLKVISQRNHPCLVNLVGCFQSEDYAVLVLEYIPGGDLMHHIQKGAFSEAHTIFYAACVVLALEFLHQHNIVYRDLKLENLLLAANGYLKLVDFGLCKEGMGPNDKTSTFCGTPDFVAPEMITDAAYTRAVDWWCLGILIYEMAVGKCPFSGVQNEDIYNNIVRHEPKIPLHVSARTVDIIGRFLTKDPSRRLGATATGLTDVKEHAFFSDIDFDQLLACQVKPPFIPAIVNMEDVSNFDQCYTSEVPQLPPSERQISPQDDRRYFADFEYI